MARKSNKSKKDGADVPMGKPKAAKPPKAAKATKPGKGHNSERSADAIRAGFIQHRGTWNQLTAKQKSLDKLWTDAKAALKADGYKVIQMQIADDLGGSLKQEAKVHTAVHDRLQVAQWVGHPMGAQLDMFAEPDRTPAADKAYDEGWLASASNEPAKPHYDPSVPQHARWLEGYNAHQKTLMKGFKPLGKTDDKKSPSGRDGWGEDATDPARPLN